MTKANPHVLVARLDNAGDVLLAGPAVRAVAASAARVSFVCGPRGRAAAELLPGIDAIIELDAPWVPLQPRPFDAAALADFTASVADAAVDEAIILTSAHQSALPLALLLRTAGVPCIAATSDDYAGGLLDVRHRRDGDVHEVEHALELVAMLGHRLSTGDGGRLQVRTPLSEWRPFADRYVVVHPGASVPARALGAARATDTVRALTAAGWRVAVTGSREERRSTARLASAGRDRAVDLGGLLDLAALAGVLQGASVLAAGNTGPAHLAAAVGTPVVSVFAPVVPAARWRPYGVPTVLLGDQNVPCRGCRARCCPIKGQPCLSDASGRAIASAVRELATTTLAPA